MPAIKERLEEGAQALNRLNQELLEVNGELRQRNNELDEFAHIASHDLQEPLRKITSFSEVLAHENRRSGVRFACVCPPPVDTPLLAQADSKPKMLDEMTPIPPERVLDAIERSLEKGRLFVFPGRGSKAAWRARRWTPGLVWRRALKIEGL